MASKREEVKVVRCTLSELKELAKKLETRRGKVVKTVSNNTGKLSGAKTTDLKEKSIASSSNSVGKNPSKQNKTKPKGSRPSGADLVTKKASNTNGKLLVDLESVKEGSNVLNNEQKRGQVTKKNVSFSASGDTSRTRQSMGSVSTSDHGSDNEYKRGESPNYSGATKFLYDPESDGIPTKTDTSRSKHRNGLISPNKSDICESSKTDLSDKMNKLHITSGSDQKNPKANAEDKKQKLRKLNRKKAENLFADCGYLESDLNNILSRRLSSEKQLNSILKISTEIQEKCKLIMLLDLHFFTTKEVYQMLWKNGLYQVIERLRGLQRDGQDHDYIDEELAEKMSDILLEYLDAADTFIQGMIASLEKEHDFELKVVVESLTTYDSYHRLVKMALLCCHHYLIFLGDIERYKQSLLSIKDWSLARSRYLKASKIAPRNGKPYNQLAVVAVYAKRRLDAVYYYVRSLTVSNPIMTAREKLHAVFDDVQRKAYELHVSHQEIEGGNHCLEKNTRRNRENDRLRERFSNRPKNGPKENIKKTSEGRHELWVFYRSGVRHEFLFTPDGLIMAGNNNKDEEKKKTEKPSSAKISLNEINKQFEIFYLCSHAMLYSKMGIDHFTENHRKVLGLFKTLLRHPALFGAKRLVEIMAINMFEVANLTCDDFEQFFEGTPLDLAVNLGCDMFQCLCEASLEILQQHSPANNEQGDELYHVVLAHYLPALKVWFDWLKNNVTVLRTSSVSFKEDLWCCIAMLLNSLIRVYVSDEFAEKPTVGDIVVSLTEDDHLKGFKLLAQASKPRAKVADMTQKGLVCQRLRIEAMQGVARFLCEFEDLPLRLDESSHHFYVTKTALGSEGTTNQHYVDEIDEEDIEDDVIVESIEDFDSDVEVASPVKELKAKKDALTKEIMTQKQREDDKKAVLVEHSSKPTLVLEINPQYLVPDTNCFINHLSEIQRIVESKDFTFVIPLVVINELDGLAKGLSGEENVERLQHAEYVAGRSREAIDFLEYCFSLSDSQMLALTSKGSVLTTIAFRSEEPTKGRGINDDVILNCCHHYCDTKMDVVNKLATPDQPFTIRRKVVLVTEDRNLRLKAHVQNIPVVTVPQFLEMITT